MTYEEHKTLTKRVKISLLLIVLGALCVVGRHMLTPEVSSAIAAANEITSLDTQVSNTKAEIKSLDSVIQSYGKAFVDLSENKDNYVRALGQLCNGNLLNIHKMTVGNIVSEEGGLSNMCVELELQGDLAHIRAFIDDMYDSEMLCRINSISYRLTDETFSWMWRAIDDNDMVSWWDISTVTEYLLTDPDESVSDAEKEILNASAFMKQGTALCYMTVQFIGTGVDLP